jgi:holin-like protein
LIGALGLLLACDLAGEALRLATHAPVPGPVIGMLLLAALLILRQGRRASRQNGSGLVMRKRASKEKSELFPVHRKRRQPPDAAGAPDRSSALDRVSNALISHMGLLFVPAGVGVIAQLALLKSEWPAVLGGLLGSTVIGLVVTALVMHWGLRKPGDEPDAALGAGGAESS